SPDGTDPSASDAKRMIEAYLVTEHPGDGNKTARQLVKAAFDLANRVQHDRAAEFRDAALCAEGAITAVNTVAILSGRRDETPQEETAVEAAQRRARDEERRRRQTEWLRSPKGQAAATSELQRVAAGFTSRVAAMSGPCGFRTRQVEGQTVGDSR